VTYILNSLRAKEVYFGNSLIEGMTYKLEESEKGFSAQMVSPVFRVGDASKPSDKPKIELIDKGESEKSRALNSQDEIESKKQKLEKEAEMAEKKAEELKKHAEEVRRKKAELENFASRQQFPPKK
jgi:hypothetical protein